MLWNLLARLREPSTHAGIAAVAILAGQSVEAAQTMATAVAGVSGVLAVVLPERGGV